MSFNKPISLARLSSMSWDELRVRTQQAILKRWDAGLYGVGVCRSLDGFRPSPCQENSRPCTRSRARFFWNSYELPEIITIMREKLPREVEEIIQEADRICLHRLDLLGYRDLDFGPTIDWHLDVVHEKRSPRKPF